jgi:Mg-chelatase subunit ChlI
MALSVVGGGCIPLCSSWQAACRLSDEGMLFQRRAAKAMVAYQGRTEVTEADVEKIITSCLNHR